MARKGNNKRIKQMLKDLEGNKAAAKSKPAKAA